MKEFKVIKIYFTNALQQSLASPIVFDVFCEQTSALWIIFIFYIFNDSSDKVTGRIYSNSDVGFYLCFNVVDTIGQMLFREVYRFRPLIISGGFDMVLVKPLSPLVRVLLGWSRFY